MDVYFGFLFLGFGGRRRVYHSSVTFFLFCRWINRCLLLLASREQRKDTKQANIPCQILNRVSKPKLTVLLFGDLEQLVCYHFI